MDYQLDKPLGLIYYGNSDFLAQICDHVTRYPDSCLAKNLIAFYNSLYSELFNQVDCSYQVQINENLCQRSGSSSEAEILNSINMLTAGMERQQAEQLIDRIYFSVHRNITETKSETV